MPKKYTESSVSHTPSLDYSNLIGKIRDGVKTSKTKTTESLSRKFREISLVEDGETVSLTKDESLNGEFTIANADLYYLELFDGRYFYLTGDDKKDKVKPLVEQVDSSTSESIFVFDKSKSAVKIPGRWMSKIRRFIAYSKDTKESAKIFLETSAGVKMTMHRADTGLLYGYVVDGVLILRREDLPTENYPNGEAPSVEKDFALPPYEVGRGYGYLYSIDD